MPPPPGLTPGHLTFLKNFGQIPRYVAGEMVKCPTRLSFKEGQIPHPPGMLKQLWTSSAKFSATTNFLSRLSSLHTLNKGIFHEKTI